MDKINVLTYEEIEKKIKKYIKSKPKINLIKEAFVFAEQKHQNKKRLTGEPHINHSLNVVSILTTINADAETLAAAFLHDILEDSETTIEELEKNFAKEITDLIIGFTKINKLNFKLESEALNVNYRKILVGLSKDVRVIIIKLADRLHNMQTLWVLPTDQQKTTAKETIDILIPIAHRLGINKIKSELEDLSLRYLKPDAYFSIVENLNKTKQERDQAVEYMRQQILRLLAKNGIKNRVKGRAKSIYSIYTKLDKGRQFSNIYDLMALRILVDTEAECYQALGVIHAKYRPVPKRFKDYIAMPKTNMYQSLHTTVFGAKDNIFEIQIRTPQMDEIAEKGIASHWSYKEGRKLQNTLEEKLQFFRSLMELKDNEEDLAELVKEDVFNETIYVYTPKGDVIELPNGATPIDFAYKVHSQVGHKMVLAMVNNNIVPFDHQLQNQDIVKIKTNTNAIGPNREWINLAKTTQAKNKIKAFYTKIDKDINLEKGAELINKELRTLKINNQDFYEKDHLKKVLKELKLTNLEELYQVVGSGKITANHAITCLNNQIDKEEILIRKTQPLHKDQLKNEIIVEGMADLKVNIAACCMPVYGDDIIGYITKGHGINVHRTNCPNIKDLKERFIDVKWQVQENKKYQTTLMIYANNEHNLLFEILAKAANFNISVKHFNDLEKKDDFIYEIIILVDNKENLEKFIASLLNIKNIDQVERLVK